jgi:hypothetical protein
LSYGCKIAFLFAALAQAKNGWGLPGKTIRRHPGRNSATEVYYAKV